MNARTIRRAAERKARKLAWKTAREQEVASQPEPTPVEDARYETTPATPKRLVTSARQEANRANALLSTGPKSEAGRKRSSLNAVKTALTGRTVLLPTDDVERYEALVADWQNELQPESIRESALVQSIADSYWRTERILRLEYALYAAGREQFADEFAHLGAAEAAPRIEAKIYLGHEKQLRNLGIQEARLRRQREKDLKELEQLQAERRTKASGQTTGTKPAPAKDGFVFENEETSTVEPFATQMIAARTAIKEDQTLRQVA